MKTMTWRIAMSIACACSAVLLACGNPSRESVRKAQAEGTPIPGVDPGTAVKPPFDVRGEAEGLLLVWYDERGESHLANQRTEIPEARRASVRVDALELPPDQRLEPDFVYVADLRAPGKDGAYPVRKVPRESFEAALPSAPKTPQGDTLAADHASSSEVIIYGASWCGACKQAARFFTQKGVPFVEKDIEKEPGARGEMLAKAEAQGVRTNGIPVIDVRGTLLGGFNAARIEQLLARP